MKIITLLFFTFIFTQSTAFALTNSIVAEDTIFDAVSSINTPALDPDSGDLVPGYCNATIINDHTLVTAAHCLVDAEVLRKYETTVEVGQYKYATNPQGVRRRVGYAALEKVIDPKAQFIFPQSVVQKIARSGRKISIEPHEDFAVIVLSVTLPIEKYRIQAIPTVTREEWLDIQRTRTVESPTVVTINFMAEMATTDIRRMGELNQMSWTGNTNALWIESKSNSRVAPGDSGAPVFVKIKNQWKILAVTKGAAKSFFGSWDVFCAVGNHLNLIR